MATFLLTMGYWAAWLLMAATVAVAGAAVIGTPRPRRATEAVVDAIVLHGVGLSVVSLGVLLLGLMGAINAAVMASCFAPLVILGAWRLGLLDVDGLSGWRAAVAHRRRSLEQTWATAPTLDRWLVAIGAVPLVAMAVTVFVGALAPDLGQDSLWYHLSVPGQWLHTGRAAMVPGAFPSLYTLGFESVYTAILGLTGNDTIVCGHVGMCVVVNIALPVVAGFHWGGVRGGAVALAFVPGLIGGLNGLPPVGAKHDAAASLMLAVSVWIVIRVIDERRGPTFREGATLAWISALAVAGKLTVALFWAPVVGAAMVSAMVMADGRWRILGAWLAVVVASLAIYAPWLVRAWLECGNPLVQLSPTAFAVAPDFFHARDEMLRLPRLYGLGEWSAALQALPHSLNTNAVEGFVFVFVLPVAALVPMVIARSPGPRVAGVVVACWLVVFTFLRGASETARYFAVCYPAAAPAVGCLCAQIGLRLSPRWLVVACALLMASSLSYAAKRHARWSSYSTIQWKYVPLVLDADRRAWASGAENAMMYAPLLDARPSIPRDAYVAVLGLPSPYYLDRRAEWSDFALPPLLHRWWGVAGGPGAMNADAALADLHRRGITHVLAATPGNATDPRLQSLIERGALQPIAMKGEASGGALWSVASPTSTTRGSAP